MATEIRKFLDAQGVTTLWGKVAAKIATDVKSEETRALLAEQAIAADVADLEKLVGTLPEGTTAKDIVDYVNVKTTGIATDAALEKLQGQLNAAQGEINTIKGDYLKAADIADMATDAEVASAVGAEETRAKAEEERLAGLISAIDFIDETELATALEPYAKSADVASTYETIANADLVRGRVADLEAHKDDYKAYADQAEADAKAYADGLKDALLGEGIKDTFDTLVEIQTWIEGDGVNATELSGAIAAEAKTRGEEITRVEGLVTAEAERASGVEAGLADRIKAIEDADHDFSTADATLKSELMTEIDKKADAEAMTSALAGKASTGDLADVKAIAEAAATKVYVDEELAKKADKTALEAVSAVANAAAVKTEVNAALALKADQSALEAEVTARQNAVKANSDAIAAIKDHASVDSFADVMAEIAKKQDIIPANTYDVHGAAAQALTDAKAYTDAEVAKIQVLSTVDIENAIAAASV